MSTQDFIHSLEQGKLAKWIVFAVIVVLFILAEGWFVFWHFAGMSDPKGMDQAQIAREFASGHGYSTKNISPLMYAMWKNQHRPFPLDRTPDIYEAPLNPVVNSVFLLLNKKNWTFTSKQHTYSNDQIIASVSIFFLALGIGVNYLTACRVFDPRVAGLAMGLMLFCNQFWEFAVSGLPQLLMFFIFSCCLHFLFRAIEARRKEKPVLGWLCAAAFCFGLLALAHPLAILLFVGALVFCLFYFVPKGQAAAIMLAIFCVVYTPWLARNYKVCGSPLGLGPYSVIGTLNGSEINRLRGQDTTYTGLGVGALRAQVKTEFIKQTGNIYGLLGQNPLAPIFFLTLLYVFKRREASDLLWCTFAMFVFGFLGMTIVSAAPANNLYLLFTPIMTLYGFAYIMMLWSRLEFNIPILRYIFIGCIYFVSAIPLLANVLNPPTSYVQWPNYVPMAFADLNTWTNENEVIASDEPWAVAWYGDRKSLLIPVTMDDFLFLCDWTEFTDSMAGVYLTPMTADKRFLTDVIRGTDKDWTPLVLRGIDLTKPEFPFRHFRQMPYDGESVFYAKTDRWSPKTD